MQSEVILMFRVQNYFLTLSFDGESMVCFDVNEGAVSTIIF